MKLGKLSGLRHLVRRYSNLGLYCVTSLLILGLTLKPGYVMALDMVFAPDLKMPGQVSSSYLFLALLHLLNTFIAADLIQKLLLFGIFVLAGCGMHRLVGVISKSGRLPMYFAGLLYMVNPFTYERLMTGQYNVLFGYALLPWFTSAVWRLMRQPNRRLALVVVAWALAISIVSIHTIGMAFIVAGLIGAVQLWHEHRNGKRIKRLALYAGGVLAACVIAAGYWLIPVLAGVGPQAQTISSITSGDRQAFATGGSNTFEQLANVLGLQGFWAERYDLFTLPQNGLLPVWLWTLFMFGLIALVIIGAVNLWRRSDKHQDDRAVVIVFGGCIIIGVFLAAGIGGGWMAAHIPLYAGYREPQKFTALIALGYAVFSAHGVVVITQKIKAQKFKKLAWVLLLVPILLTSTIWWGANNQLRAVEYPDGWYAVNRQLNKDHSDFKVLALPWHLYMFIDFAGRTVANPSRNFFDKPVITSDDPELNGAALDRTDPATRQINALLQTAPNSKDQLGKELAAINVKYIILEKTSDYHRYDYLAKQTNLTPIANYPEITLYRITNYKR